MNESFDHQPDAGEKPIDPMEYVRVLLRRKWIVLIVVAICVTAGATYAIRTQRLYSARTSVIIDLSAPNFLDDKQVGEVSTSGPGYYWISKEYYETQYKVITSRSVAQRVVDKLGLNTDENFLGITRIKDPELKKKLLEKADPVARLQGMVKVSPVKDSRVVEIVVTDVDPARAALFSNEVADAYIEEILHLKAKLTDSASEWLEDRLVRLEDQTKKSELALYDFKKQSDMLSTSLDDRVSILSQRLQAVNGALTEVDLSITDLTARVESISKLRASMGDDETQWAGQLPITDVAKQNLLTQLKVNFNSARTECVGLQQRYLDNHPMLNACQEKLKVAEEALSTELRDIVSSYELSLREARTKKESLEKLLEEAKAEAFKVNKSQIEVERLKRSSDNDQRLYEAVLKRIKDLELTGLLKTSNVRVLDRALPSGRPIKPDVPLTMTLALMLGVLAGLAGAFLVEWMDDRIIVQRDVEERVGLPFLGVVPTTSPDPGESALKQHLHIHFHPNSAAAEHCRAVRTNLLFMSPDKPFRTMLVTSSGPQEGKSTNVINLGIAMAQSGSRVLLVDTDMRRPRLHKAFGLSNDIGVSSLIVGERMPGLAVKSTEVPNLFLLPSGPIPPNPAELLHTEAFKTLLKDLSEQFDRVILDTPPIGAVADALVLSTHVDGVLLVLRAGQTRQERARRAVRALNDVNARIFGAVLNGINPHDRRYGEYYAEYKRYGYYADASDAKGVSNEIVTGGM